MDVCCDLQVDVNGEETFMVKQRILVSYSSRFSKLFRNLTIPRTELRVIFYDFPGGAGGFELLVRYCYNNGRMDITASNIGLLHSAAYYLEMGNDVSGSPNLIAQTEKFLEGIRFWTWSDLLEALRQSQNLLPSSNYSSVLDKILDNLIERIAVSSVASPYVCSSNSSSFKFSCDASSTGSWKNYFPRAAWWFEDLLFLNSDLISKLVKIMMSQNFDRTTISKFLFYYHKLSCHGATQSEKQENTEVVINLLSLLDRSSIPCNDLFDFYQVSLSMRISTFCKNKIESLIGSQLDQATIDYLLVPSPHGQKCAYDVNLVLRLVLAFGVEDSSTIPLYRLMKVAKLMDTFLVEVAPDPHLKPSDFAALVRVLPDSARECHDQLYLAMDLYLKVHEGLSDKEKASICCALNYEKLSAKALRHLAHNTVFPLATKARALVTRKTRIKNLLQETDHLKTFINSMLCKSFKNKTDMEEKEDVKPTFPDVKEFNLLSGVDNFGRDLRGIDWKIMEYEQVSEVSQSQTQPTNSRRSNSKSHTIGNVRYLPKLCS